MEDKENPQKIPAELEDLINKVDTPYEGADEYREDGTMPTYEERVEEAKDNFRKMFEMLTPQNKDKKLPMIIQAIKLKISPQEEQK